MTTPDWTLPQRVLVAACVVLPFVALVVLAAIK